MKKRARPKIYEKNQKKNIIRWRYIDESPDLFSLTKHNKLSKENVVEAFTSNSDYNWSTDLGMETSKAASLIANIFIDEQITDNWNIIPKKEYYNLKKQGYKFISEQERKMLKNIIREKV